MFGRNVDFTAVLFITLMMLGLGWVRSLHWTEAYRFDSHRKRHPG